MDPTLTDSSAVPSAVESADSLWQHLWYGGRDDFPALSDETHPSDLLADLDAPDLVVSEGYIGPDRRANGFRARVYRATFGQRRAVLRFEFALVAAVVSMVAASVLLISPDGRASVGSAHNVASSNRALSGPPPLTTPSVAAAPAPVPAPTTTVPAPTTTTVPAPTTTTVPAPTTTVAPAASPTAPVPVPAAAPSTASLTPEQMGAQALTLVRYPWQSIPGYSIQFLPISDAPSPGFYGNTTFTWGHTGGTSVMYVYPGETVERLAAITAFEIGHEVDAAAVEPQGGEAQIENVLGIHPASWAPNCDCAEQGFLSGWYAAAFSNYWSPGVGNWSQVAPEPSGAVLAAIEPWLHPTIA
jgi:hypothetical protein